MTDSEKIEALEKTVAELRAIDLKQAKISLYFYEI